MDLGVISIQQRTNWNIRSSKPLEEVIDVHLLHNPHSAKFFHDITLLLYVWNFWIFGPKKNATDMVVRV